MINKKRKHIGSRDQIWCMILRNIFFFAITYVLQLIIFHPQIVLGIATASPIQTTHSNYRQHEKVWSMFFLSYQFPCLILLHLIAFVDLSVPDLWRRLGTEVCDRESWWRVAMEVCGRGLQWRLEMESCNGVLQWRLTMEVWNESLWQRVAMEAHDRG